MQMRIAVGLSLTPGRMLLVELLRSHILCPLKRFPEEGFGVLCFRNIWCIWLFWRDVGLASTVVGYLGLRTMRLSGHRVGIVLVLMLQENSCHEEHFDWEPKI